ncbi:unnamed protein product, partial [Protopolystoma xenopodis]
MDINLATNQKSPCAIPEPFCETSSINVASSPLRNGYVGSRASFNSARSSFTLGDLDKGGKGLLDTGPQERGRLATTEWIGECDTATAPVSNNLSGIDGNSNGCNTLCSRGFFVSNDATFSDPIRFSNESGRDELELTTSLEAAASAAIVSGLSFCISATNGSRPLDTDLDTGKLCSAAKSGTPNGICAGTSGKPTRIVFTPAQKARLQATF